MKRLIFLNDILFHDPSNTPTYHWWFGTIMNPAIELASGTKMTEFIRLKNDKNEVFNRTHFFKLSDIYNITNSYFPYDIKSINKKSWDYLFSFIGPNDLLIGVELGMGLREILTQYKISFINFWFHSFHLFNDWCFMINTNDKKLYTKIKKYMIPKEKFYLYTSIAKKILKPRSDKVSLDDNCCLFIGQTFQDKSVEKDGVFLNITHFEKELNELSKKYKTIYYIPHPLVANTPHAEIDSFIKKHPYIKILKNIPTYVLLASDKVKEVVGISSSVLYEAQYFGKKISYLYQSLFDIDEAFGLNTFISVYNDYLNPAFWCDLLEGLFPIQEENRNKIIFDSATSAVRDIANTYHGYRYLDRYMKMVDKTNGLETKYKSVEQRLNDLNTEVHKKDDSVIAIWRKIKSGNKCRVYIFGIPFYKRVRKNNYKKVYILGIPVYSVEESS